MRAPAVKIDEAYEFAAAHGLEAEAKKIQVLPVHPTLKAAAVRKASLLDLFEAHQLLELFFKEHWPTGFTEAGLAKRRHYNQRRLLNEKLLTGTPVDEDDEVDGEATAEEQKFALEADLRDFLAHNLQTIEPGLRLYEDAGRTGVEFQIDGGRIDILALDKAGTPVVIELKLSRGRNHTIGQLLFYMGWVDRNLGRGPSRGMIIARAISDDLILATQRLTGVSLYEYAVAVSVRSIVKRP